MSYNIYEDVDCSTNARFSKEVNGEESVETIVDIYEGFVPFTDTRHPLRKNGDISVNLREKQLVAKFEEQIGNLSADLSKSYCHFGKEKETEAQTVEWQKITCSCYYASKEKNTWAQSQEDCQRKGASLLIIYSKAEHDLLRELNYHGDSWIGLEMVQNNWGKGWRWIDGSEPSYVAWKTHVNTKPEVGAKAYIDQSGNWMHTENGTKHWICERMVC
ncbi:asialoglycoprotein receptor 2-like isoform 2-T2 [Menidia menidia]